MLTFSSHAQMGVIDGSAAMDRAIEQVKEAVKQFKNSSWMLKNGETFKEAIIIADRLSCKIKNINHLYEQGAVANVGNCAFDFQVKLYQMQISSSILTITSLLLDFTNIDVADKSEKLNSVVADLRDVAGELGAYETSLYINIRTNNEAKREVERQQSHMKAIMKTYQFSHQKGS